MNIPPSGVCCGSLNGVGTGGDTGKYSKVVRRDGDIGKYSKVIGGGGGKYLKDVREGRDISKYSQKIGGGEGKSNMLNSELGENIKEVVGRGHNTFLQTNRKELTNYFNDRCSSFPRWFQDPLFPRVILLFKHLSSFTRESNIARNGIVEGYLLNIKTQPLPLIGSITQEWSDWLPALSLVPLEPL